MGSQNDSPIILVRILPSSVPKPFFAAPPSRTIIFGRRNVKLITSQKLSWNYFWAPGAYFRTVFSGELGLSVNEFLAP